MEKVKIISEEQYKVFKRRKYTTKAFKDITGIELEGKYGIGDSAISVSNANELDIFKDEFKGNINYYIVLKVINTTVALALSLYPV